MSQYSMCSKVALLVIVIAAVAFTAIFFLKRAPSDSSVAIAKRESSNLTYRPPPLPGTTEKKPVVEAKQTQPIGRSYDKYLTRIVERMARPKFTDAEVQKFLARRGKDPRTLAFAALMLRDRELLEEARSLNPEDIHVIHCDAQFAIDEIRGGNPDALDKIVKLLADHPESESLQMALLYSTWLHDHFVTSKMKPEEAPKAFTPQEYLRLMPKTGNHPSETLSYRDLMYDILLNEKGINAEDDLILKTFSDPYPLTPSGGGSWLLKKLLAASQEQSDPNQMSALNEFAARQLV